MSARRSAGLVLVALLVLFGSACSASVGDAELTAAPTAPGASTLSPAIELRKTEQVIMANLQALNGGG